MFYCLTVTNKSLACEQSTRTATPSIVHGVQKLQWDCHKVLLPALKKGLGVRLRFGANLNDNSKSVLVGLLCSPLRGL